MNNRSRWTLVWALSLALPAIAARAQEGERDALAAPEQAVEPARGELESLVFVGGDPEQFGRRDIGSPILRKVHFENTRPVPVHVDVLQKSCSCLGAAFDRATIAPSQRCTLTLNATVSPSAGEQVHFATFRARWEDGEGAHEERGICYARFTPAISFVVRPEAAAVSGIRGSVIDCRVTLRSLERQAIAAALPTPEVDLDGWSVTPIPAPGSDLSMVSFRVVGEMREIGMWDVSIRWKHPDAPPVAAIPLRVASFPAIRVFPGGAVFLLDPAAGEPSPVKLRLVSADGAPIVHAVRCSPARDWVRVRLVDGGVVEIELVPSPDRPKTGTVRAELISSDAEVLMSVPIVWWSRDGTPG